MWFNLILCTRKSYYLYKLWATTPNLWPYVNFLLVYFLDFFFFFHLKYSHGRFKGINIYFWMLLQCQTEKWRLEQIRKGGRSSIFWFTDWGLKYVARKKMLPLLLLCFHTWVILWVWYSFRKKQAAVGFKDIGVLDYFSSVLSLFTEHEGRAKEKFSNPIQQTVMGDLVILKHFVLTGFKTFHSIVNWLSYRLSNIQTVSTHR